MSLSLFNALQALLCALSLLLGAYIWSTRRSPAMALFFFVTALHTILRLVHIKLFNGALISGLTFPLSYLYGSLIFIAVSELLFHSKKPWWPHFLPALIALSAKLYGIQNQLFFDLSIALAQFAYLAATVRIVFHYSHVSNTLRSTSPEGIIWLKRGLALYTLIVILQMLRLSIDPLVLRENAIIHLSFHAITSIVFALIIFQIMRFPGLLKAFKPEEVELVATINEPIAVDKTTADAHLDQTINHEITSEHRHVMQRIETLMTEKKPFREPELSLNDMAELLDIPARLLSQTINLIHQCNFPEYINRARVDEAKRLLDAAEWSRRSLLEIGLEAGFNSKSSFNLMFKRISNITPSAYRRMVRDGEIK
jgi:AraC-like DNA-binding protein